MVYKMPDIFHISLRRDLSKRLGQLLIHRTHYGDSGNDEPEKLRVGDQFVTDPFAKGIIILTEIIIRDRRRGIDTNMF